MIRRQRDFTDVGTRRLGSGTRQDTVVGGVLMSGLLRSGNTRGRKYAPRNCPPTLRQPLSNSPIFGHAIVPAVLNFFGENDSMQILRVAIIAIVALGDLTVAGCAKAPAPGVVKG